MQIPLAVHTLLQPSGCIAILGQRSVTQLAWWMAAQVLLAQPQAQVVCIDGANRFDPLTLARLSRAAGVTPQEWLRRVKVSRAYSGDQLVGALVDRAIPEWRHTAPQLCLGLGWLESLYDEDVADAKAQRWLEAVLYSIQHVKRQTRLVLFESAFLEVAGPRTQFIERLLQQVDQVLHWTPDGRFYG